MTKEYLRQWLHDHPDKAKAYRLKSDAKRKKRYATDPQYREHYKKQQAKRLAQKIKELQKLRDKIFQEHENKCDKCGFDNPKALIIHHNFGNNSKSYYQNLKEIAEHKVPINVLCANCHMILHNPKKIAPRP